MKYAFLIGLFFSLSPLAAQSNTELLLRFVPMYGDSAFSLASAPYAPLQDESLQIETLRFYISQVQFYQGNTLVFAEANSFHLIDAEVPEQLQLAISTPEALQFDRLIFQLGIDSTTNSAGAMGGDLDPIYGMYWTWQSGYINFKLEGIALACPARKHRFQFHLGGYQAPFHTLQEVALAVSNTPEINIKIALDQFLAPIDWTSNYQVMSPNQKAVEMAQQAASIFSIIE